MNEKQLKRMRDNINKLNKAGIQELRNSETFIHMPNELQQLVRDRVNCYVIEDKLESIIAANSVEF